ncbi:MAG: peptide chain release factor N(5)-glutamine methyltransferase [Patescibacteria group bacterium]
MNSAKIDPLDAELLIARVLNKPRGWVLANPEARIKSCRDAKSCVCTKFIKLVNQRAAGVPLAYLTGHKEFFGLDFEVNENVLVPRPDTEILVEEVLSFIIYNSSDSKKQITDNKPIVLIDVGTGSGCIPIAIAKHIRQSGLSGNLDSIIAVDISKQALIIAKRNAKKHHVKIKFIQGNLFDPLTHDRSLITDHRSLIITANLPYLTNKQYKNSPSIQHEPKLALVAKNNGLALYKKLLKQIKNVTCYVSHVTCFMEIDPSQSTPITRLIKSILPTANVQIIKDLAGLDRIVKVCYTI